MEEHTKLKFKQLEVANSSTLLIYSRDRNDHSLAKKLRPEFSKVLMSAEAKDCQRIIARVTNDNKEASQIDILVAEFDMSIPKLVDYINKRPHQRDTNMCPLIPIVIITKEGGVRDAEDHLMPAGGVNKVIAMPINTQEMFASILDLLYHRRRVEDTFTNIKKHPLISAKFPYLSIFEARPPLKLSDAMNENESMRSVGIGSTMESTIEEIDDASESSSLLPEFVKNIRQEHPELKNKFVPPSSSDSVKDLHDGFPIRSAQPSILKRQGSKPKLWMQRSSKIFQIDDTSVDTPMNKLVLPDEHLSSVDLLNSNEGRVDSYVLKTADSLDNPLDQDNEANEISREPKINPTGPQIEVLLDPAHRPHWSDSTGVSRVPGSSDVLHDYSLFVERHPPSLQKPSTVSGLDRKTMQHYWKGIKRPLTSSQFLDKDDLDKATLPRIGSMKSLSTDSQPKTPSKAKRNSIDAGNSKVSHEGSTGSEVIWLRKNSTCSDIFSLFSTSSDHLDTNRFYRKIAGVARRSIVDLQVSTLLEIDFSCRLINLGEKEMLERGLSLQKAGDLEAAVIYYARAGAHSKDPQISRMLIGNVEYSRNKLLSALRYYGLAVSIIESKPPALRPLQDAFIGYYNRAVIHFRLGDDEEGLKDLEQAVIIDPKHMQARELLSLVKRRLGKYNQAIEDAIISKNYKVEMKRKEQQQQAKAKEDAEDPSNAATATSKSTYLNVLDEGCRSSLKERVQEAKLNIRQDDDDDTDAHIGGGYLKMFKMQNNFKMELFDELFHRPTDMQGALLTVPSDRTPQQLETIANLLSFFVPFQSLTRSTLQELATVIEYRAISNQEMLTQNNKLFRQNSDPYAVCMLVKGSIYSHLDYFTQQSMSNIPLDEYTSYEVFGHIDYLFHSMTKSLVKVVEEVFALKHKLKAFKDDGESISSEDDFESDGDQDDGFEKKLDVHDQAKASAFKQLMSELQSLILEATTNTASKLPTAITGKLHRQSTIQTATNTMASASHMNSISRAIRPGMFATYTLQQPSELLVLSSADYYKYMFAPALDELKLRLETLKSSGLFSSWRPEEIIRLARMARVEKKNRGARILNQGQKPNHLYLIMRGICKVLKKPNRTEMLVHKLEVAREKAYQHDLKYVFHHKPIEFSFDNMFSSMGSEEGQEGVEGEVGEVSVVTGEGSHSKGITSHGKGSSHTRDVPTTPQVKPSIHHEKNVASSHPVAHTPTAGHRLSQPHPHTPFTPTHHSKLHASTPNTPTRSPHNRHHLTVVITPTGDRIAHTPKHDKNTPKSITTPKHGAHSQPFSTLQPLHLPPSTPSIVRSKSCATPKGISTPKGIRKPENLKAFKGLKDVYAFPTTVEQAARKLTSPERERQELADEIIKLEELISQARVQDALDTTIGSASKSFDVQESPIANARPFSSGRSFSFKKPDKEAQEIGKALGAKEAEIATLQWPRIFGEASVLDPDQGVSRGSVVADTSVEVLVIHKKQIQTFQIDDTFLDRVKAKALVYPGDPDIVVSLYRKNEWSDYRKEVMKGISTTRWPKSLVAHEPFSV